MSHPGVSCRGDERRRTSCPPLQEVGNVIPPSFRLPPESTTPPRFLHGRELGYDASMPPPPSFRRPPGVPGVSMAESWVTMPACPLPRHSGVRRASPVSLWPRVGLRCQHPPSPVIPASAGIHVASPESVWPRVGARCQHPPSPVIPASAGIHVASPESVLLRVAVKAYCTTGNV